MVHLIDPPFFTDSSAPISLCPSCDQPMTALAPHNELGQPMATVLAWCPVCELGFSLVDDQQKYNWLPLAQVSYQLYNHDMFRESLYYYQRVLTVTPKHIAASIGVGLCSVALFDAEQNQDLLANAHRAFQQALAACSDMKEVKKQLQKIKKELSILSEHLYTANQVQKETKDLLPEEMLSPADFWHKNFNRDLELVNQLSFIAAVFTWPEDFTSAHRNQTATIPLFLKHDPEYCLNQKALLFCQTVLQELKTYPPPMFFGLRFFFQVGGWLTFKIHAYQFQKRLNLLAKAVQH